jgi:2-methylisocitrate lyase-like PEP mutase family enzyme
MKEDVGCIRAAVNTESRSSPTLSSLPRTTSLRQDLRFYDAVMGLKAAVNAGANVLILEAVHVRHDTEKMCNLFTPIDVQLMYRMVQGSSALRSAYTRQHLYFQFLAYTGIWLSLNVHLV